MWRYGECQRISDAAVVAAAAAAITDERLCYLFFSFEVCLSGLKFITLSSEFSDLIGQCLVDGRRLVQLLAE